MDGIEPSDGARGDREEEFVEYERRRLARENRLRREYEESLKEQDLRDWRDGGGTEIPG